MLDNAYLTELCRSTLGQFSATFLGKEINADFYPFIGLTHTIRRRGAVWMVRISDHCRYAPREVLESIVVLLACKVLRRKPPLTAVRLYDQFRREPEIDRRLRHRRLERGRKQMRDARGRWHSLDVIFRRLNLQFFNGQVELSRLGWSTRRSWSRLGHYDPVHHSITISPVLDSSNVPEKVLAYLLYHEMLHTLFNGTTASGRQRHHTRDFYRAERAFPDYAFAKKFLDRYCRNRGRRFGA